MQRGGGMSSTEGPTVLGINAAHDAAACLLVGGELRVAVAEERLSRRKYDDGFPQRAIDHCLSECGLSGLEAVDCIALNEFPLTDFAGGACFNDARVQVQKV